MKIIVKNIEIEDEKKGELSQLIKMGGLLEQGLVRFKPIKWTYDPKNDRFIEITLELEYI